MTNAWVGKGIGIGPTLLLFALFGTVVTLPIYFYAIAWHKESTIRNESCEKIVSQVAFDMNSSIREAGLDKFLPENSPDSLILDYSYSRGERYLIAEGIEPVQLRQSVWIYGWEKSFNNAYHPEAEDVRSFNREDYQYSNLWKTVTDYKADSTKCIVVVVDGTANYSYLVDKLPLANLVEDSVTPYLQKLSALVFEQNNENRRKNAEIEERKSEIQKILSGSTSTQKQ